MATAHGRFTVAHLPDMPGFAINEQGFRVRAVGGDLFRFNQPLTNPKPMILGNDRALWQYGNEPNMPSSFDFNLAAAGFSSYWPQGFALHLASDNSPRLTVKELTVDSPNPTSPSQWMLISFVEKQAPVLFIFDKPVQTVLNGNPGDWILTTLTPYSGRVRVCLPLGQYRMDSTVEDLGAAAEVIEAQKAIWLGDAPRLVHLESTADDDGVTTTWKFDRPSAVVPTAILFAQDAGYPLQVLSKVILTKAELDEGPQAFTKSDELTVHFPVHRYPSGEPLFLNATQDTDQLFWPKGESRPPWLGATVLDLAISSESADYWTWSDESDAHSLQDWAAVAGSRAETPATVSMAAMLHAGSQVRPILNQYRADRGFAPKPVEPTAPFTDLRKVLFGTPDAPLAAALNSPLRATETHPVRTTRDGDGFLVSWQASSAKEPIQLMAPWGFDVDDPVNLGQVIPAKSDSGFSISMSSVAPGLCSVHVHLPKGQDLPSLK